MPKQFKHKTVAKAAEVVLDKNMYAEAAEAKMSLSQYLERVNVPSERKRPLADFAKNLMERQN